jgi:selenium-binding protein 1
MVLELRPAHDLSKAYGFVGVVVSLKDLPHHLARRRNNGAWEIQK